MTQHFTLKLETGNAAFDDAAPAEIARILRDTAARIEFKGDTGGKLRDINGNTVGEWELADAIEPEDDDE